LFVPVGSRPASLDQLAARSSARPETIAIEPGGMVARVEAKGADPTTNEMAIPKDPRVVGWYEHGPVPGELGSAVIAGHVAFDGRRGAFAELVSVEPGAVVLISFDDGSVRTFRVDERRAYTKAELPTAELFRRDGAPTLALITCGGAFDRAAQAYTDNIVLLASPI
jgi:sortase (surface protein transpeptidase)